MTISPALFSYGTLALAIICEVTGSAFLQKSEQFSKLGPTALMVVFYLASFFFLAQALKYLPLGIAYAIWAGLGIVLTATVRIIVFKQSLDPAAIAGIAMIIGGVLVINLLSHSAGH